MPWEDIHHQVALSQWLYAEPHPAASRTDPRWKVDLALLRLDEFRDADLPSSDRRFKFDAFLEFKYLANFWTLPGATKFGAPASGHAAIRKDIEKVRTRYIDTEVAEIGYVVVFEDCDWQFPADFVASEEAANPGCKVRFVRGYSTPT